MREDEAVGRRGGAAGRWGGAARNGTVGGYDEGPAYNGFFPIGSRGPFCACAARFKLRSPLGAGVCAVGSQ